VARLGWWNAAGHGRSPVESGRTVEALAVCSSSSGGRLICARVRPSVDRH
jgi:hypothetical protein